MKTFLSNRRFPLPFLLILPILAFATGALTAQQPKSFEEWLVANAIPEETKGPQDRNGPLKLANLEAYAYGLNPFTALKSDLPQLLGVNPSTGMRYFYRLNVAAEDLEVKLEGLTDLNVWAPVTPDSEQVLWTVDGVEGREALFALDSPSRLLRLAANLVVESSMVRIEAGSLPEFTTLGPLDVAGYSISKFEVTWAEWLLVRDWAIANGYEIDIGEGCSGNHPVQRVNWYDVVKWCNAKSEMENLTPVYKVDGAVYKQLDYGKDGSGVVTWDQQANGYRLPTEPEWEYAARGGQSTNDYIYSGSNDPNDVAWWAGNSGGAECALFNPGYPPTANLAGTWPVGLKLPNELGLFDMSGNVWEWCWSPSSGGRYARGGAWLFPIEDFGGPLLASRNASQPQARYYYFGFRLARN